ncbi:MAG TPA: hypothetical protein DCL21_03325, partial [Alphaproteobacteria bacterium]|nr:hypothetical protein [Alphaproteobacteria bacterium]
MPLTIYDDEYLTVFYDNQDSNVLIISFSPLNFISNQRTRYWGESICKRLNTSFLGFVAKGKNWYPGESITKAASASMAIIDTYDKKISLGTSMGGYASIKYSNLLNVDYVVSFSPQYCINPETFGNLDKRFSSHYIESIHQEMQISGNDCHAKGLIFYDRFYFEDNLHINKIKNIVNSLSYRSLNFTHHFQIELFLGSENMKFLIKNILKEDFSIIYKEALYRRRTSSIRLATLTQVVGKKRPELALKIINNYGSYFSKNGLFNAYHGLALNNKIKNNYGWALHFSFLAIKNNPSNSSAIINFANLLSRLGFSTIALRYINDFLDVNNKDPFVLNAMAGILITEELFLEAITKLENAIEIKPHEDFYKRLIRLSLRLKMNEKALYHSFK